MQNRSFPFLAIYSFYDDWFSPVRRRVRELPFGEVKPFIPLPLTLTWFVSVCVDVCNRPFGKLADLCKMLFFFFSSYRYYIKVETHMTCNYGKALVATWDKDGGCICTSKRCYDKGKGNAQQHANKKKRRDTKMSHQNKERNIFKICTSTRPFSALKKATCRRLNRNHSKEATMNKDESRL